MWVSLNSIDAFFGNPRKCARTEASRGLSLFALSSILPLLLWNFPLLPFLLSVGHDYNPVSGAGLKAMTAVLHRWCGLCLKTQICKTGLAANPHKPHWTTSAACPWISPPRENKLFQYQEHGEAKGEKKIFEQRANKISFEAVPADTLSKIFLV